MGVDAERGADVGSVAPDVGSVAPDVVYQEIW
jgi:hypothetical protein